MIQASAFIAHKSSTSGAFAALHHRDFVVLKSATAPRETHECEAPVRASTARCLREWLSMSIREVIPNRSGELLGKIA
jgi:hypothetical protein